MIDALLLALTNTVFWQAGVKPSEILALNSDLQLGSAMVPDKLYKLPRSAVNNSAGAVSDLIVEFQARKTENKST